MNQDPVRLRRWALNVASSYAGIVVGGVIYIVLTPIIVARLGTEAYAVWIISHTITFYLGFLDLGIGRAQVRYHARYAAKNNRRAIRSLIGTTVSVLILAGVIAAVAAGVLALSPAGTWIGVPASLAGEFRAVLLILGLNLLFLLPASALSDVYAGAQRFDLENARSIGVQVAAAVVELALLLSGHGLVALALVELSATMVTLFADLIIASRLVPGLFSRRTRFSVMVWRSIRPFALWTVLDEFLAEGTQYLDRFLIVALLPIAMLSPYAIVSALGGLLLAAVNPIADTFFPLASELHAKRRIDALGRLTQAGAKLTTALAAPLAVFLFFFGDAVLAVWVPDVAAEATAGLVALVSINLFVSVFLWTPSTVLLAMGRFRQLAALTALEIAISVTLVLVLAPRFGLHGVAAAALVSNAIVGFGLLLPAVSNAVGPSLAALIGPSLGRVLAASAPVVGVALTIRSSVAVLDITTLGFAGAAIAAAYVPSLLLLGLSGEERSRYRDALRTFGRRSDAEAEHGGGLLVRALGSSGQ